MQLSEIFKKPIDRQIEGVIKADDDSSLRVEVDEYVLTKEVAGHLSHFLEAYVHSSTANGVWISGFFGSGKSHLLKMLSLLLENRAVDGESVLNLFDPKWDGDALLKGDAEKAVAIPSRSVLFNIDQKANIISTAEEDAVLKVFMNVFDELRGYYGKKGYIARLEKDLDKKGCLGAFRSSFEEQSGEAWESARELADLYTDDVSKAFEYATGNSQGSGTRVLEKYFDDYRVSIEDFANEVREYIHEQEDGFRLNFFVDEVGQYIGESVKLMTNLQTIAESLATKCDGRSWIFVTAQEDMDSVIGEMDRDMGEDFSKIQARFAVRLKLTSTNVSEVIQKRLLAKTTEGERALEKVYTQHVNNFKTLLDFADGSTTYRNFRDEAHFVQSYPFVPYQYSLFQASIQSLSKHNAFEGRHTAVGERSMLGVFQDVATHISDQKVGRLATFDRMFEGIRNTVKSSVHQSILTAEGHLDDDFATRVLKALFLVKYVDGFKPTVRNLTVLMLESFDMSVKDLRERVEAAVNRLESETYVHRNGEVYEYLTDQEKDIEREIKDTEVDSSKISDELGKLVFDPLNGNKIRYAATGQDFPFARKLDDRLLGRDYELTIHIASPFHEHSGSEGILVSQHMGRDELLVIMPSSERLIRDLKLYLQTDTYVRMNEMSSENDAVRRIIGDKRIQNAHRRVAIRQLVNDLMRDATYVASSKHITDGSGDAASRIQHAFQELVTTTYPNLQMLRGKRYAEAEVPRYLDPESNLYADGIGAITEPESDLLGYIKRSVQRVTLKDAVDHYGRKPYGWESSATLSMVAKLIARGKLELKRNMQVVEGDSVRSVLMQSTAFGEVVLMPLVEHSANKQRQLADFYREMFDGPPPGQDARTIAKETAAQLKSELDTAQRYLAQEGRYPCLSGLQIHLQPLQEVVGRNWDYYLEDFLDATDALLELKEDVLEPLASFMTGPAQQVYVVAQSLLTEEASNLDLIESDAINRIQELLLDPNCVLKGRTKDLGQHVDDVKAAIKSKREMAVAAAEEKLAGLWASVESTSGYAEIDDSQKAQLKSRYDAMLRKIRGERLIAVIRHVVRSFQENEYLDMMNQIATWVTPASPVESGASAQPPARWISRAELKVEFEGGKVETNDDAARYADALKKAMIEAIASGKKITL